MKLRRNSFKMSATDTAIQSIEIIMPSRSVLNAAQRILAGQAETAGLDAAHIAVIIEEELGFADAITALRKCDKALEQLGVSVNERDYLLKAIAKLEGSESLPPAEAVIGTVP
ncbi:MAG: hypothetical protein ACKV0T_21380 [Planctomycetales bacterium]